MNRPASASPQGKTELVGLTSLRGIAAILVMYHHFFFVLLPDLGKALPSKLFLKSYLCVDLFFLLSGFVLAYVYHHQFQDSVSRTTYRIFMQTRFARIYPLHFVVLMAFVAFEGLQWQLNELGIVGMSNLPTPFSGDENAETLITNLLLVQTFHWQAYWNQPAWSISAEWLIYFSLPLLMHKLLPIAGRTPVLTVATCLVPLAMIEWHFGDLGLHYAGWPMLIRCLCEAALGVAAFRWFQAGSYLKIAGASLVIPVLLFNVVLMALPGPGVVSVFGFLWLVLCCARLPGDQPHILNCGPLAYLGKISYSIYLIHWFVLDVTRDSIAFFQGTPAGALLSLTEQAILVAGLSLVVLLLSHLGYHLIEVPLRQRLKPRPLVRRFT